MVESTQPASNVSSSTEPQFYTPPPPPGDPPADLTATQSMGGVGVQTQGEPHGISTTQGDPFANPRPQEPATNAPLAATNPFNDAAAFTQPSGLQEPPQHPERPLPLGAVTETPLHNEPAPILPPRPPPEYQVPPPPRASFDQPIPDHPAMRQQSLGRAQSPTQIQRVAMTPVQPQPIAPPPQALALDANPETLASDPAIASLHAMFPDFELLVLQSVLEATGGDKDQAVDSLLAMSDPDYAQSQARNAPAVPEVAPGAGANAQGRQLTQTELDEEFARRLMLEEEEQANAGGWQPANNQYSHSVPYQQYQRRSGEYQRPPATGAGGGFGEIAGGLQQQFRSFVGGTSARTGAGGSTQGGSGAGYQEQFNKIADTGKKTFNTIFSKVKQKMEEFDNRNPPDTQHMNQPPQSGHWSNWQGPPAPDRQQQVPTYAQSPAPGHYPRPAQSPPATTHHGALNSNPYHIPETMSTNANSEASNLPRTSGRWQYQPEEPETLPNPPSQTVAPSAEEPRKSVDAARLGLLPKRPVSLMDVNANTRSAQPQPPPQPQPVTHAHDSDDDSLEYVDRPMPGAMARP
ncbi:CUE domain protein [Rhizoctonia solani 123E]|uniref:CUE domain protein n=1 Tax=Rhizoctonia solani 123E TaxID=1423351 RepID=A0A074RUS5_9AGAM|nr:CUE domain protein [Rhizoctonia solani 123E]